MFDQNQSNQTSLTGQQGQSASLGSKPVDSANGSKPAPLNGNIGGSDLPPSNQPPVMPKEGRSIPGTEDIFAETENLNKKPEFKAMPKTSGLGGPPEPLTELPDDLDEEKVGSKKLMTLVIVILVVAVIGAGGYYAYGKFLKSDLEIPKLDLSPNALNEKYQDEAVNLNLNKNSTPAEEINNQNVNTSANQAGSLDSDKDGLTDEEERSFGTDINEPDSDGDGLFDKEEIKVYKTNPLDPDTDNDGYIDGDEVKSGYNPNGPGNLLEANF